MQISVKVVLLFILFNFLTGLESLFSQDFEGEIVFSKETHEDTSFYAYKIKEDLIRVEELDNKKQLINYMLVDISQKTILAVNPSRKLFVDMPVHMWRSDKDSSNYKVIKSDNYQMIKGFKCYQWRIQNKKEDTEVSYWVCKDHYKMFSSFLKIINRTEKTSSYFLNIPEIGGFFPMMSVERSMLREMRMQLTVISIQKKSLPPSTFEVPADYKLFQKN